MSEIASRSGKTQLMDIVFPGDTNHHGTLFGGVGLAHMDKVAFIVASRHAYVDFVTASCEHIDFEAPAHMGEIVELTGRLTRVGRRSLSVEVEMVAEAPLTGERRRSGRGLFNMVAVGERLAAIGGVLPPMPAASTEPTGDVLRMVDLVFPGQTSHYGSLYGGDALAAMAKAAFVAATRRSRAAVVLVSTQRVDFTSQIGTGEIIEVAARIASVGRTSMTVEVDLFAENLRTGESRSCAKGVFVMVAVGPDHRPREIS